MTTVRHMENIEAELTEMNGYCPSSPEFEQSLKQESGGTAGGPLGITDHIVKSWPVKRREAAYRCMADF